MTLIENYITFTNTILFMDYIFTFLMRMLAVH